MSMGSQADMSAAGPSQGAKAPRGGSAAHEVASVGARKILDVVADRFRLSSAESARVIEAIEVALKRGSGRLNVYALTPPLSQGERGAGRGGFTPSPFGRGRG